MTYAVLSESVRILSDSGLFLCSKLTGDLVIVELIAKGIEILSHARDIGICDVLLAKKLFDP